MNLFRIREGHVETIPERSYRDEEVGAKGEATLEQFLVDHPEIIPGQEMDSEFPPTFVVIQSQAGVTPGSMDILMVDNEGVPTIIETKLIDNREIRRSVLAQGLEYLAHLQTEWSSERMKTTAEKFWSARNQVFDVVAEKRFQTTLDESFWNRVQVNLQSGKMRLIIAADKIPPELRTVIEFLNETAIFDVYGMEVQFFAEGLTGDQILVPHILGSTERIQERKRTRARQIGRWNEERFFETVQLEHQENVEIAHRLLTFAVEVTERNVDWGTGTQTGSFTARLVIQGVRYSVYSVYTDGTLSINIGWNSNKFPETGQDISEKYRILVEHELELKFEPHVWKNQFPKTLLNDLDIEKFEDLIKKFVDEVKAS
jgi:hypothetical protein